MDEPDSDDGREPPRGSVTATGPGPLVMLGVLGLVAGWALRPVSLRLGRIEPNVSVLSIFLAFFVAAIIGGSAYLTRRTVRRNRASLAHHQAVNRLVLGKACALVGALVTGCYLGYALAQLGVGEPASVTRLWRSLIAALGTGLATAAALLLEQACRVPRDRD